MVKGIARVPEARAQDKGPPHVRGLIRLDQTDPTNWTYLREAGL